MRKTKKKAAETCMKVSYKLYIDKTTIITVTNDVKLNLSSNSINLGKTP